MTAKAEDTFDVTQIPELVITRTLKAPRSMVFRAWLDPRQLGLWWAPDGFTNPVCELDPRPGGAILVHMKGPDGSVYPMQGAFVEIDEPRRLVLTTSYSMDGDGSVLLRNLVTVVFEEQGNKTLLTLHVRVTEAKAKAAPMLAGMEQGWTEQTDRLVAFAEGRGIPFSLSVAEREMVISRLVSAPRSLVYKAFTDPKHVNAWWGPDGFTNTDVEEMDVRVGGTWRFKMKGPDGQVYPSVSVYRELKEPERLVYDHGDGVTVLFRSTITFEDREGKTLVTIRHLFANKELRDMIADKYQAVEGARQTLAKLESYLKTM